MGTFTIGGEQFAAKDRMSKWELYEVSAAYRSGGEAKMAGMHDFIVSVVDPGEHKRLREFLIEHDGDLDAGDYDVAIGDYILVTLGVSGKGRGSSEPGSESTKRKPRVASLSPDGAGRRERAS